MDIILASNSPRRKEILNQLNLEFRVIPSKFEEIFVDMEPQALAEHFAYMKAKDVYDSLPEDINADTLIIGSDTIVFYDDMMGKPENEQDAFRMLRKLSGREHMVISGISVIKAGSGHSVTNHAVTKVKFRELSDDEINHYIESGECWDKAGAYAIQGMGSLFVEGIEGCYFNVVGLPVQKLNKIMNEFGIKLL